MNTRALILLTCVGVLVLSAARVGVNFHVDDADTATNVAEVTDVAENVPSPEPAKLELLEATYGASQPTIKNPTVSPALVEESTLWLARAIFSETKVPHEQELVAWVIRNRVETGYRGRTTYKDVVLDPYQFSAFNPGASKRSFFLHLTPELDLPSWQQALWIAHYVRHANPAYRPFSVETRHFYSERSMKGTPHPYWANRQHFVSPGLDYEVNERRFRFYKEIS